MSGRATGPLRSVTGVITLWATASVLRAAWSSVGRPHHAFGLVLWWHLGVIVKTPESPALATELVCVKHSCCSQVSIAMTKTMTESNMGRRGLVWLTFLIVNSSLRGARAETHHRNFKAGTEAEAMKECVRPV